MNTYIGKKISWTNKVDSTNDSLSRMLVSDQPPEPGEVYAAIEQVKGKGQGANSWKSKAGENLTFSYLLHPNFLAASDQFNLNMAVSLGVYELVKSFFPDKSVKIKWPNDIYVDHNKIAGILISHSVSGDLIDHTIVGIGLNVNQLDFPDELPNPISMKQISRETYDLKLVLQELLLHLNNYYQLVKDSHLEELKDAYKYAMFGYFKWLKFKHENEAVIARITGISELGFLQLETHNKQIIQCDLKDIEFLI